MKGLSFGALLTAFGLLGALTTKGGSLLLLVFGVRRLVTGYRRMRSVARHFDTGCALPGIVVNTEPYTVAALTDLSTSDHAVYNAVRIMPRPLEKVRGRAFVTGDRVPCVALYSGRMPAPKWDTFNPVPAIFATDDRDELTRLEASIPESDWTELNEALFQIPKPYRNGLFQVDLP